MDIPRPEVLARQKAWVDYMLHRQDNVQHEQCSICMKNKLCVCRSCSADLHECPLCRKAITDKLKAFI
jgi:hypothetical protein